MNVWIAFGLGVSLGMLLGYLLLALLVIARGEMNAERWVIEPPRDDE